MWKLCLKWSEDQKKIIAHIPGDVDLGGELNQKELPEQLAEMDASQLFVDEAEVVRFINCARERKAEAYDGIIIAELRNAEVSVELSNNDMLASMCVVGAHGGRGLRGPEIVQALANAKVSKGINKLALKKVMVVSTQLKPGETFVQPVAVGKQPIKGKDAIFTPLVKDISKRVLKPKQANSDSDKIDLKNLGETITVDAGDEVMRRTPATKGTPGFTVQGKIIPPQAGKDSPIKPGKGTEIAKHDPNLLLATVSGMPMIKEKTIEVDNALCLNCVGVNTGHVKFKGNVFISGDIESGMIVKATGSVTVGGFIESADVQAQGDIEVGKGIIGHTVPDGEPKSCHVKSKGSIKANYAQFSELQSGQDIELAVHSMNNDIKCGHNLTVLDASGRNGTLSGGVAKVGDKVKCLQLGVEGDTATKVEAFARYTAYKEKISALKEEYKLAQEGTMEVIRKELEFKKRPKAERTDEEQAQIDGLKERNNKHLEDVKSKLNTLETDFEVLLEENVVEATERVFTRVTVQFGDEQVITKRTHGGCVFSFNQYEIKVAANLEEEDVAV
ncbi:polymerase [Vibrio rotiferianus]|uniref:Polymerase n=1 Tax=Vibrio rotiferianus TaxID=190895 RepID=A0ABX3DAE3_9VIBR|nr:FapA family protein [Vibrio rotiferianus]OHY94498.1 polymerase [Vibrio rotiferianus]